MSEPKQGWLYRYYWGHAQSYDWSVPVSTKDGWYMQDTYQLDFPACQPDETQGEAAIRRIIELADGADHSWAINNCKFNYYYEASKPWNEKYFEPVCDLREYRIASWDEAEKYNEEDVIAGVQLYHEHGYSWSCGLIGVCLVKKEAKQSDLMVFRQEIGQAFNYIKYPNSYYDAESIKLPDSATEEDIRRYRKFIAINNLLRKQEVELENLCKELNNE